MNEILNKTSPLAKIVIGSVSTAVAIVAFIYAIMIKDAQQDGLIQVNTDNIKANKQALDTRLDKIEIQIEKDNAVIYARMDKDKQDLMKYIDKMESRLIYRLDRTDKKVDQVGDLIKAGKD